MLKDVQSGKFNGMSIQKVGVRRVKRPVMIYDPNEDQQWTIAEFDMYVKLPGDQRGTHMSRFIEIVEEVVCNQLVDILYLVEVKDKMKKALQSDQGHITCRFPYFYWVASPTGPGSRMFCSVTFHVSDTHESILEVVTLGTSCCPCSKEISERGAHNQRSEVLIRVQTSDFVLIEEFVEIANSSMSCPMYPLLKRPDEKVVTERAYDNPKFVEDTLREVVEKLKRDSRITWYHVSVTNEESIHPHDAYAEEEGGNFR